MTRIRSRTKNAQTDNDPEQPLPMMGLRRGLDVLEIIAHQSEGCAFNKMRDELDGVAATTLSRILKVLQATEWIDKDKKSGRYILANRTEKLGRLITGQMPHEDLLMPVLTRLAEDADETAAYFENGGDGAMLLAKVERQNSAHMRPAYSSTDKMLTNEFGMVCLAWRPRNDWRRFYKTDAPKGKSFEQFARALKRIRNEYFFCRRGGPKGAYTRLVAPVFRGDTEDFAGAIGITVMGGKLNKTQIARYENMVVEAAAEAARLLGAKA